MFARRFPTTSISVVSALLTAAGCSSPSVAPHQATVPDTTAAGEANTQASTAEAAGPADAHQAASQPNQSPAAGPHPFTVHDMLAMDKLSDPRLAPDGSRIAFVRKTIDIAADAGNSDIWLVDAYSGQLGRLTHDPASDGQPRWSPDGRSLYFISTRSGSSQVWRQNLDGSPAQQLTDFAVGVSDLEIAPTGDSLVVSAKVYPDCRDFACTAARQTARAKRQATGEVYDRLFMRHWDSWKDGRRNQLFSLDLGTGAIHALSAGLDADVPSSPFGGSEEYTYSPDGKTLVFSARDAKGGNDEPRSTNFDLYAVAIDGRGGARKLTDNPAWDAQPSFSPDGSQLAYLAMKRPGFEADRFALIMRNWADGTTRELVPDWDRSTSGFTFTPDGRGLIVTAADTGNKSLFHIDIATGAVETLVDEGYVSSPMVHDDQVYFSRSDFRRPADLWRVSADQPAQPATQLTAINAARLQKLQMGTAEQISFPGWRGEKVHAWVMKPANFDPSKRYPVAFLIHGGPQGSFANQFHYRWNPQAYAGAGYAVVMVDFHGSTGYGQKFTDSITGDWGGKPLVDLEKGWAAALKQFPWMDGERACALGASYGGYMINWIASQWNDTFRCLVNHDGIFDNRSMAYTTEELWFVEWEHGGAYYEKPRTYEKSNPVNHVDKWKTPMMVIHGALDYRVPLEQGLATFTALQRRDVPSRFLYFPDENHWVLSPNNSIQWHEAVLDWLGTYTAPAAAAAAAKE